MSSIILINAWTTNSLKYIICIIVKGELFEKSKKSYQRTYGKEWNILLSPSDTCSISEYRRKKEFTFSLRTSDYRTATIKYTDVLEKTEQIMNFLKDGTYLKEDHDFEYYSCLACSHGRTLQPIEDILNDNVKIAVLVQTLENAEQKGQLTNKNILFYVNTNISSPKISQLTDYYKEYKKIELKKLNSRELSRKIDPLKNACNQLINFLNKDIKIDKITRKQARSFKADLVNRVSNNIISANTANKYLTHMRTLIKTYFQENDLENENVFEKIKITEEPVQRSPLTIEYITEKWLKNPLLDEMKEVQKCLLWAMIDTGCGPKELCGLNPETDIKLDATIPHIIIQVNSNRQIKSKYRERKIPLTGYALKAFKLFPKGFEHYATINGPTNASAALNKFLKKHNLFENEKQTLMSTRHCFKDRLRGHNIEGEMQDYLMGHKTYGIGSHYGKGHKLEQIASQLRKIENDYK